MEPGRCRETDTASGRFRQRWWNEVDQDASREKPQGSEAFDTSCPTGSQMEAETSGFSLLLQAADALKDSLASHLLPSQRPRRGAHRPQLPSQRGHEDVGTEAGGNCGQRWTRRWGAPFAPSPVFDGVPSQMASKARTLSKWIFSKQRLGEVSQRKGGSQS